MINLRLSGGIGNQIFQFGACLYFRKKTRLNICINTAYLGKHSTSRVYSLGDIFNISKAGIRIKNEINIIDSLRVAKLPPFKYLKNFINDENYYKLILNSGSEKTYYIDGYFISSINQDFFNESLSELKNYLWEFNADSTLGSNICVIHIRGGDFLKFDYAIKGVGKYYCDAIDKISSENSQVSYRVITDDIDYAKKILNDIPIKYQFYSGTALDDFNCLRSAKYKILSNSTFAFWAAALDCCDDSIVIAPTDWTPGVTRKIFLKNEK